MKKAILGGLTLTAIIAALCMTAGIFTTNLAKAGATEYLKVTNVFEVRTATEFCGYVRWVSYEPVVGNGSGHYYDYHIMNQPGHTSHGWSIVGSVMFGPYEYRVDSCSGYR